jgi:hypothetical protein
MGEDPYQDLVWRYRTLRFRRKKWIPLGTSSKPWHRLPLTCLALVVATAVGIGGVRGGVRAFNFVQARRHWSQAQQAPTTAVFDYHLARMDWRLQALGKTRAALGVTEEDIAAARRKLETAHRSFAERRTH